MNDDRCTSCGSESLWSGFFDADDYAVVPSVDRPEVEPGTRWTTFCNDCGTEQVGRPRRKAKR